VVNQCFKLKNNNNNFIFFCIFNLLFQNLESREVNV
jgi:hypothetical protein